MPAEQLTSLFSSLSMALNIAKGLKSIDDQVKLNDAVFKLQEALLNAQQISLSTQQDMASLIEAKGRLEKEISKFREFEAEKSRYSLNELDAGGIVYTVKEDATNSEPTHHICANCYQESIKSILQHSGLGLVCSKCKSIAQNQNRSMGFIGG